MSTLIVAPKATKNDVSKAMKKDRLKLSKLFNTLCKDDRFMRDTKTGNIIFESFDKRNRPIKGTEKINEESIRTILLNYIEYAKKNKGKNNAFEVLIENKNYLLFKSLMTSYDIFAAKRRNKNIDIESEHLYSEYFALCLFNRLLSCSTEVYNLILQYFSTDNTIELQKLIDITFITDSEKRKMDSILPAESVPAESVPAESVPVK